MSAKALVLFIACAIAFVYMSNFYAECEGKGGTVVTHGYSTLCKK